MSTTRSALSSRNYLTYLTGSTLSLLGLWIYRVALAWYAWELSRSELWVGIVAATQFAPAVIFGPVFGVLADRLDRKRTSILINSLSSVNMVLLGALTAAGHIDIHSLVVLSLVQGVLDGGHAPVRMSIVPNLVAREQLQSAIALTSVAFNLSRFIGPAIAGVLIAAFGVATAFVVNGVSYLALIGVMIVVNIRPRTRSERGRKHPWNELMDGARYAFSHRAIRGLLIVSALASVCGRGALEMLPVFADDIFSGGASALAILTSAVGAGAVIGGLALSRGHDWLTTRIIRYALSTAGILVILLGVMPNFAGAVSVVALLGITLSLCGIGAQILIQSLVDDEVRGRVSSFWGMIAFGGTSLGSLLVGTAASAWNLQSAVIAAGGICVLATWLSGRTRS
ncbi:MFS transporter [Elongatibacter sediminis]|uniref:MFS transporter n=1 Tax=Elongatibacter sediminis TaxID=3119006 RepID=A0AAW9RNM8_9GAMM